MQINNNYLRKKTSTLLLLTVLDIVSYYCCVQMHFESNFITDNDDFDLIKKKVILTSPTYLPHIIIIIIALIG